jgi:hypothetical protein
MAAAGLSQQAGEAEGSPIREVPGRVGAALTTPGRAGTARRPGSGKRDGKVYECRNQWWNPLKARTGSNLVDVGRAAVHAHRLVGDFVAASIGAGAEAVPKVCGVGAARLQGKSWAPPPSIGTW